jgi:hypothetical protein
MAVLPIFNHKENVWEFLDEWEQHYPTFKADATKIPNALLDPTVKAYFVSHQFVPRLDNLRDASAEKKERIVGYQKEMRKKVRGWFGNLG